MVSHCACPKRVLRDRALVEHRRPLKLRLDSYHLSKGSIQIVLYCAHRGTAVSSRGLCEQEGQSGYSLSSASPISTDDAQYRTTQWGSEIEAHLLYAIVETATCKATQLDRKED